MQFELCFEKINGTEGCKWDYSGTLLRVSEEL